MFGSKKRYLAEEPTKAFLLELENRQLKGVLSDVATRLKNQRIGIRPDGTVDPNSSSDDGGLLEDLVSYLRSQGIDDKKQLDCDVTNDIAVMHRPDMNIRIENLSEGLASFHNHARSFAEAITNAIKNVPADEDFFANISYWKHQMFVLKRIKEQMPDIYRNNGPTLIPDFASLYEGLIDFHSHLRDFEGAIRISIDLPGDSLGKSFWLDMLREIRKIAAQLPNPDLTLSTRRAQDRSDTQLRISPELEAFLAAEVRNERSGGDAPTTFGSAISSLTQMSEEDLKELNDGTRNADLFGLYAEISLLSDRYGPMREVAPYIDVNAGQTKPKTSGIAP